MNGDDAEIRSREGWRRRREEEEEGRAAVGREVEAMDMAGNGGHSWAVWALCGLGYPLL